MGTNFYLGTSIKETSERYFGYDAELTDTPKWGYQIHIAKTSCGWLPLFQAHNCFESIKELKELYDTGEFFISDEYGTEYNWEQFEERVLKFNGGVKGVTPRKKIEQNNAWSRFYDPNMPEETPVSHFDYAGGRYADDYFTDEDGYEFANHWFE